MLLLFFEKLQKSYEENLYNQYQRRETGSKKEERKKFRKFCFERNLQIKRLGSNKNWISKEWAKGGLIVHRNELDEEQIPLKGTSEVQPLVALRLLNDEKMGMLAMRMGLNTVLYTGLEAENNRSQLEVSAAIRTLHACLRR